MLTATVHATCTSGRNKSSRCDAHGLHQRLAAGILDVARPFPLDQRDDIFRHRDIIEFLGHLPPLVNAQSKNLSASLAAVGSCGCFGIRMNVAAVIGHDSAPGSSV